MKRRDLLSVTGASAVVVAFPNRRAFGEFIRAEITRWTEVVNASGAKVE